MHTYALFVRAAEHVSKIKGAKASVNKADRDGLTPLHLACMNGKLAKKVELLVEKNASVNAQSKLGRTPLHMAAANRSPQKILFLLQHAADETIPDNFGVRPLWMSALVAKPDQVDGLRVLLGFPPEDGELRQIQISSHVDRSKRNIVEDDFVVQSPLEIFDQVLRFS